jgi:primosomal protein N'
VALDVPLAELFDYACRRSVRAVGDRVPSRSARASRSASSSKPRRERRAAERMKPHRACANDAPRLSADWLELMRFLSAYYQRPLGRDVVSRAAAAAALRRSRCRARRSRHAKAASPRIVANHD